jgi:cytochrome c-type biogenesis protein CcsB
LDCLIVVFLRIARISRWIEVQHFPISNLYESLVFLSFLLSTALLILQSQGAPQLVIARASRCPLLVLGFASFCLPAELQSAGPLVPALKSNWLLRHVTVRIISYAGLRLGSLRSILWLAVSWVQAFPTQNDTTPVLERLDQASYRLITFGFPFLTLGILSGAVWANETWGSYWSWDPKETWSLITWLVFAVYLHTRLMKGQVGLIPAFVAAGGFIVVWVCYLGVNLLGKGLHSYGWFAGSLSLTF